MLPALGSWSAFIRRFAWWHGGQERRYLVVAFNSELGGRHSVSYWSQVRVALEIDNILVEFSRENTLHERAWNCLAAITLRTTYAQWHCIDTTAGAHCDMAKCRHDCWHIPTPTTPSTTHLFMMAWQHSFWATNMVNDASWNEKKKIYPSWMMMIRLKHHQPCQSIIHAYLKIRKTIQKKTFFL